MLNRNEKIALGLTAAITLASVVPSAITIYKMKRELKKTNAAAVKNEKIIIDGTVV